LWRAGREGRERRAIAVRLDICNECVAFQTRDGVSSEMVLMFDMFREGEGKLPPFETDNSSAVKILKAVLDSFVGTCITHATSL